ncbi:MAG TPA: amidohydrolase family protein [Candidatus Binatia bacterium]|jgi:N-acyl-D-aspartate/D-glutamate deacylase|nr:amidohydrolase family protein [Candidatus Binatia bacterium]
MADLVIRGARICDGTGRDAVRGDVSVTGGRIDAVGTVGERGTREIDGDGLVLAPGFVDLHTHYDCQLFWDAQATPSPWHGVTSVVMGNCGFTVAPCAPGDRETLMRLLCFVEGMPLETLRAALPWTWETYPQYLDAIDACGLGVNVASFIGHSAMRVRVMGADALERPATADERAQMATLVRQGMEAGAIGWSTSLSPTHFFADDNKPAPSRVAEREELLELAAALHGFDRGVIEVAPNTIIGSIDDKLREQDFFAEMARASGGVVSWAPLLQSPFLPGVEDHCLRAAAEYQRDGVMVVPQIGCRPLELRWDFATPGFGLDNNPFWRPFMAKPRDERRRLFADAAFRDELTSMAQGSFVVALAHGWDQLFLRMPVSDRTSRWQDKSVAQIAAERGTDPVVAFCDTVLDDDLQAQWGAPLLNFDEAIVAGMLRHPAAVVALSDAGAHMDTLCDQGFTTYLLGHWVRERGLIPLEEAVRLISSVPAERYGLHGRGRVAPGYAADLVLFDAATVGVRPTEMVYDLPQKQRRLLQTADGIEHVFVNGTAVVEHGVPTGRAAGRVLRGGR